jgi:large subunit ribosomal protein L4
VAAPKAPLLDSAGKSSKDVTLEESVFGAEVKPHLVHETVRAELNAARAGTRAAKSRGLVAGGRTKPWRQKGTGRARAGTTRAPQWTGGGVAFPPTPRNFEVKVNRKARRAALRGALAAHATNGTLALLDSSGFDGPSTQAAASLLAAWGKDVPVLVVAGEDEENLIKSFRNLERVLVTVPSELEVANVVWARSLLVSEAALEAVQGRAT